MKPLKQLLTKLTNSTTKKAKAKPPVISRSNRRRAPRKVRPRPRRRNPPRKQAMTSSIPMAVPTAYRKYFSVKNLGETSVRITGCDLIYKIPDNLTTLQNTNVITVIPANPAYWTGTRIAAVAQGYQNYRPVSLRIHYCPQCPVTQQGNVIGGTLWDDVPAVDSMQQSLKTSNGGFLTQCYQPISSTIRLKSNLQMNLYRMAGDLNQQSNPFFFIALSIATYNTQNQLINPGIFYVEYTYILKNPIGVSTQYKNTGITLPTNVTAYYTNAIAVTCAQLTINNAQFPPGTRLDIETDEEDQPQYYYNNTKIDTPTIPLWILMNQPISQLDTRAQITTTYTVYYTSWGTTGPGTVTVPAQRAVIFWSAENDHTKYTITYNHSSTTPYTQPLQYQTDVWLVDFDENGVGFPMQAESHTETTVTFKTNTINIDFQEHPGRKQTVLQTKPTIAQNKPLIDYGIIGPDADDPDFDSSLVKSSP